MNDATLFRLANNDPLRVGLGLLLEKTPAFDDRIRDCRNHIHLVRLV